MKTSGVFGTSGAAFRGRARPQVLVVDDSAVAREVMTEVLSREFAVTTAADPIIAMDKIALNRPDVIVLDLEMPRMHGLVFLRKIREQGSIPVVVCSSLAGRGTDVALRALEEGAVDVVAKPALGVRGFLDDAEVLLVDTVRGACQARRESAGPAPAPSRGPEPAPRAPVAGTGTSDAIIAIGASTGGTEALRGILERMPADAPGVVIVQHMPEAFTAAFARRLDQSCAMSVKEAASGDEVGPGRVLIAPGDHHLAIRREGRRTIAEITQGPLVSRHRPSVDVLFRSVAAVAGRRAVGALLTGMGADGAAGLLEMRNAGARTIAQDEASSVVFGMPKEAIARGAAEQVAALTRIPYLLLAAVQDLQ